MPVLSDLCERPHVSATAFQFLPGASPALCHSPQGLERIGNHDLNQPCTGLVLIVLSYSRQRGFSLKIELHVCVGILLCMYFS